MDAVGLEDQMVIRRRNVDLAHLDGYFIQGTEAFRGPEPIKDLVKDRLASFEEVQRDEDGCIQLCGKELTSVCTASNPPAEAPITMIFREVMPAWMRCRQGGAALFRILHGARVE
jgi:hypothetical protein